MVANWQYKKIADVCSVLTDGNWIESKDQSPDGIRLIQTGNIGNGVFKDKGDKARYISEETFERLSCTEIFEGDVLVSRLPEPIGRSCILPKLEQRTVTAVDCSILRFKKDLLNKFFVYFTLSPAYDRALKNYITGSSRKRISRSNLGLIKVPVPPIEDQQRIVDELDLLTGIIDKKSAQLRDLDALAQSIFYEMFGDPISNEKKWALSTIDRVCKSIIRGPFGSALKKEFFVQPGVSTYKVYEQKHAIRKSASIGSYYIDNERFLSLSRFSVEPGDIIMSCSGTIGELFTIPENSERGIINQALLLFRLNSCIEHTYFLFVMEALKSSLDTKGAGIQNIGSVKFIKSMTFAFPDLSLQRAFSQKISRIEKMKSEIESSLKEATDLYNCRMDMYFNL